MSDESFQYIPESQVRTLGVDQDGVLGDVINRQIFHRGDIDFGGIHLDEMPINLVVQRKISIQ